MDNNQTIQQLKYRLKRITDLIESNCGKPVCDLLHAESHYVNAAIDYRTKHGEPTLCDTTKN